MNYRMKGRGPEIDGMVFVFLGIVALTIALVAMLAAKSIFHNPRADEIRDIVEDRQLQEWQDEWQKE
ncbi:MAG: hypothetical protein ACR2NP_11170 [Pirellulaceae bacterium]